MTTERKSIAVIGGGFSGSLLAIHLLRRLPPDCRVHLIERRSGFGTGMAYSTGNPNHLLNVPAGRMSAFHDAPDDFVRWLAKQEDVAPDQARPDAFVSRGLFGRYVQSLLAQQLGPAAQNRNLYLFPDEAVGLTQTPAGITIATASGRPLSVDAAVLAVGNFPPESPPIAPDIYESKRYIADPWDDAALSAIPPGSHVLVIGSGLTMVDLVITLRDKGHEGPITALSRRGLLPHRHVAPLPVKQPYADPSRMSGLLREIREAIARDTAEYGDWRSTIDGLRPHLQRWWLQLPDAEKRRFLRHLRPWWDIHRHRLAPPVAARIDALIESGLLAVVGGYIQSMTMANNLIEVTYKPRGKAETQVLRVGHIVNCSGPASDYSRIRHPLIRGLLDAGAIRPDPYKLGLDVDESLHVIDAEGRANGRLYAVGPITRGRYWEVTAVPEIRRQTEELAAQMAEQFCAVKV
jgi:uncharacterized NAD(P)/FAD-binding protein YdhS